MRVCISETGGIFIGEKDITEKMLESYNDVFADIVNVLLFDGKRIIGEETLVDTKTFSYYMDSKGEVREQNRDVAKLWKKKSSHIALCGIENQSAVDSAMPLRIYGYEGASYREQRYISDRYPVITLVLYFGTDRRWNAPKTLKGLLDIPKCLDEYINDISINVFEIAWLSDEIIEKFTSDFKIVARFLSNKRKNPDYIPDDDTEFRHAEELLNLLSAITGDNYYSQMYEENTEVNNMCQVIDNAINKGIRIGIEQERLDVASTMLKDGLAIQKIILYTGLSKEQIESIVFDTNNAL